jgi:ATP-binding cassette subfamily C exporter for protease/lipase
VRLLAAFGRDLPWVVTASLLCNGLLLAPTLYMLQVFDRVMVTPNGWTLLVLTGLTLAALFCMSLAEWLRSRLVIAIGTGLDTRIATGLFDQLVGRANTPGEHDPDRSLRDLGAIRQFLTGPAVLLLFDFPWIVLFLGVLTFMHLWLGALAALFALAMVAVAVLGHRHTDPLLAEAGQSSDALDRASHDIWRNRDSLRAMGMRAAISAPWTQRQRGDLQAGMRAARSGEAYQHATRFLTHAQQTVVLAAGAYLAIRGEITPGAMIAANALATLTTRPVTSVVQNWRLVMEFHQAMKRLAPMLAMPGPQDLAPPDGQRGATVALRELTVRVPMRDRPILDSINLSVASGEHVAIVGPSGAGKTTLLNCIVGAQVLTQGEARCDGLRVDQWPQEAWGHRVGYLPQEPLFLEGTVAENIARMGPYAGEAVVAAAKAAGVHHLILRMPNGYDTPIGVASEALTPGHRQRLALARALFGSPGLLVLDEPSANLDESGQTALLRALDAARSKGLTVIMATHQRNLVTLANQVVHLNGGNLVEITRQDPGKHHES